MEIVYVLTNPAMPGLVKIGCTSNEDTDTRISQLYTTGVPVPFTVEFACRVEDALKVEKALHEAFAPHRINPRREFFKIEPSQAIAILRLLHIEEATEEVSKQANDVDPESLTAATQLRSKRPSMNFEEMGIPIGATLYYVHSDASSPITVTVISPKIVKYHDEEMSLTAATKLVKGIDYSIQPAPYWTYEGKSLRDIYEDTYSEEE